MPTNSYLIWTNKLLKIPWWGGSTNDAITKAIEWDEAKTNIETANLLFSGRASGITQIYLYMKNDEQIHIIWDVADDMQLREATVDVSGLLINGNNRFDINFDKLRLWPFDVSITFSVEVIITYNGEKPSVTPWYEKYVVPVAIAFGTSVLGGMAVTEYSKKRR